jgi:host factor-I protein
MSVQDEILNEYRKEGKEVTIYLIRGTRIVGRIIDADKFTILVDVNGQQQLIYKHAISTIVVE